VNVYSLNGKQYLKKDAVFPALEDLCGSGCIDPRVQDLGSSWRQMVYPKVKEPHPHPHPHLIYPLDRKLGCPQSQSEGHGEEKILVL
jgi:hypothetical protein